LCCFTITIIIVAIAIAITSRRRWPQHPFRRPSFGRPDRFWANKLAAARRRPARQNGDNSNLHATLAMKCIREVPERGVGAPQCLVMISTRSHRTTRNSARHANNI
jgi:hypothetical protein